MVTVYLYREQSTDQGTPGILLAPALWFSCFTLELPWRDNQVNISCIPAGEYDCLQYFSKAFQQHLYKVQGVAGRSGIAFHSGNVAGATAQGYKTHSLGCILLGKKQGSLWGQKAVLVSRITTKRFFRLLKDEPFELKIIGGSHGGQ